MPHLRNQIKRCMKARIFVRAFLCVMGAMKVVPVS